MEASWRKADTGCGMVKWRLHTHFEVLREVPTRIDVTPNGGGAGDERAVLETVIESVPILTPVVASTVVVRVASTVTAF
ncbi:MAG: hypothetical protein ACYC3X_11755 [Pirellulaceae bacterium]